MGSIARRPDGVWRARVRGPDGRERARHFPTKAEARQWVNVTETELYRGTWVDPDAGRQTFEEYAERWLKAQIHHRPGTTEITRSRLRKHLLPTFGSRKLGSILPSEVQAWVLSLSPDLAPTTVEVVYRLLAQVFRAAVSDGILARSPCRGINLPRHDKPELVIPPLKTVLAVAGNMPAAQQAGVWLAVGAGLRVSEALGLTVDRVDWLRRTIRVDRQLQTFTGKGPQFAPPKTRASIRTIPVDDTLLEVLSRHVKDHGTGVDGLLLADRGKGWRRNKWAAMWGQAASKLAPGLRFHDLRHLYASMLIYGGQSPKVVQARLGHASITETYDTYGHLWPEDEDATRDAVSAILSPLLSVREKSAKGVTDRDSG